MDKSEKKSLKLAQAMRRDIQKGFGKNVCKELDFDCGNCQAQALIGYLNWYMNLLEYPASSKNKLARKK